MRARLLLKTGYLVSPRPTGKSIMMSLTDLTPLGRKYDSGAVGSFVHVAALQGTDYSCEFEVYADGYLLKYDYLVISAISF